MPNIFSTSWLSCVLLCILLLIIPGCKPSKKLFVGEVKPKATSELNHALKGQTRSYDWLTLKAKLKYIDPWESIRGTVYVKAKKDSVIWMRVTKFGFEGVRVRITPGQIEVINRIRKTYEKKSLISIQDEFGISFSFKDIEDMLIGNPVYPDLHYKTSYDSTGYFLQTDKDQLHIQYHLRPLDLLLDQVLLSQYRQGEFYASYEDYESIDETDWPIAKKRIYKTEEANGVKKTIELKITSTALNIPSNIIFSIPSHYERIP